MKRAEIEVGKLYSAKVDFTEHVIVKVLATAVPRKVGFRDEKRLDGVRVLITQPYMCYGRRVEAGEEKVITSRDVAFEWTEEHQARKEQRQAEAEQMTRRVEAVEGALIARGLPAGRFEAKSGSVRVPISVIEELLGITVGC
jgi:hypothetical protein